MLSPNAIYPSQVLLLTCSLDTLRSEERLNVLKDWMTKYSTKASLLQMCVTIVWD